MIGSSIGNIGDVEYDKQNSIEDQKIIVPSKNSKSGSPPSDTVLKSGS